MPPARRRNTSPEDPQPTASDVVIRRGALPIWVSSGVGATPGMCSRKCPYVTIYHPKTTTWGGTDWVAKCNLFNAGLRNMNFCCPIYTEKHGSCNKT